MEDVIVGLLFLYLFVIRPVLKQARKADAKQSRTKPRVTLLGLLAKLREKAKEAAEQGGAAPDDRQGAAPSWQDLLRAMAERPAAPAEELAPDAGDLPGWGGDPWGEVPGAASPAPRQHPAPAEPRAESAPQAGPDAAPPRAMGREHPWVEGPVAAGINLRQAVIWAEILGPPVSLRDPEVPTAGLS